MRKKMPRFIAGILFACMVAGSIPAGVVYGLILSRTMRREQNRIRPESLQI